jgi:hypothetical protein
MFKPKRNVIVILILLLSLAGTWAFGDELIGRIALNAKNTNDLIAVPSSVCSALSYGLCRATKNCKAFLSGTGNCSGLCLTGYDMTFDHCEAIGEDTLASYAAMNELCTATGGTPGLASIDSKTPTCSCGQAGREEFFISGSRKFESELNLGCTNAKEICEEVYQRTWTSSTITAIQSVPNAEKDCSTRLTGNLDPVNVWNEYTQGCQAFTYEPRFPECRNADTGAILSRAGGF